mgnify:CR=1 FL=1
MRIEQDLKLKHMKLKALNYLRNGLCVRVGVSKIHGVGLIALRDIPKGTNITASPPTVAYIFNEKELIENLHIIQNAAFKNSWGYSPNSIDILISLSEVSLLQGKLKSAERYIHRAYTIDSDNIEVVNNYYNISIMN